MYLKLQYISLFSIAILLSTCPFFETTTANKHITTEIQIFFEKSTNIKISPTNRKTFTNQSKQNHRQIVLVPLAVVVLLLAVILPLTVVVVEIFLKIRKCSEGVFQSYLSFSSPFSFFARSNCGI